MLEKIQFSISFNFVLILAKLFQKRSEIKTVFFCNLASINVSVSLPASEVRLLAPTLRLTVLH